MIPDAAGHKAQTVIAFPAAKAQKAAEAAVACSALLLQRCPAMDAATVAELLPRFAAVAELDRSQATEEVCTSSKMHATMQPVGHAVIA